MKRILSLAIVLTLALSLFAMPVQAQEEKITLTYWLDLGSTGASVMSSMDENMVMQQLQELTGIDLEFLHPAVGQATEQFNLLVASRDLPDIMEYNWSGYAGGIQKAVDDKVILALNDLIDTNAPNYTAFFNDSPDLAKQIATDDGMICVFAAYSISDYNCQSGYMIRQDWLDELNLPMPKTIADWESTLLTLMDEKDLVSGFAISTGNVYGDMLVGAWGIGSTYYVDGGAVHYGPVQDVYKDYLTTMKSWYDLGILDPDFASFDTKMLESYMINDEAAAAFGFAGGNMGNIYTAVESAGREDFNLVGAPYPVLNDGEEPFLINMAWEYRGNGSAAITTANKYPEKSVEMLDYFYGDDGRLLKSFGTEGLTFEYVDGVPTYTDLLLNNSDGLSMSQAMYYYLRANYPCVGFIETGYHEQYFARPVQLESAKGWNEFIGNSRIHKLPMVTPTTDEAAEMATMTSVIEDYRKEMTVKFIMGQESLDNFPTFVEQMKTLGVERVVEIYQAAYERYEAR